MVERYSQSNIGAMLWLDQSGGSAMYCPQCLVAYREGFTECSDCLVPLLPGKQAPELPDLLEPNLELVVVLDTNDPFALALAKGSLQQAGIPFSVLNGITTLMNDISPSVQKWLQLQVARDREAETRELLAAILEPQSDQGETI